jgi:tRNA 2-thiouridine synthesizing protein A
VSEMIKHHRETDLCGLCCAQPILRLASEIKTMQSGEVLLAVSDKSSMLKDIPAFCNQTGHPLLACDDGPSVYRFWIRKA